MFHNICAGLSNQYVIARSKIWYKVSINMPSKMHHFEIQGIEIEKWISYFFDISGTASLFVSPCIGIYANPWCKDFNAHRNVEILSKYQELLLNKCSKTVLRNSKKKMFRYSNQCGAFLVTPMHAALYTIHASKVDIL